jgi:hypothetical protein
MSITEHKLVMVLKIRNQEYEITEKDKFLDNGSCIQLITKNRSLGKWNTATPVLTKKAIKDIEPFRGESKEYPSEFCSGCKIFSLKSRDT